MHIDRLDHLVLTVSDIEASCTFYTRVLGMEVVTFGNNRRALSFGRQKINLHPCDNPFEPKAERPTLGSADLCFIISTPLDEAIRHLASCGVAIIGGPAQRTGAEGPILSAYFRDPDMNLIEIANTLPA